MDNIYNQVIKMARKIRAQFVADGIVDYELKQKLEDLAYKHNIDVYFDEDDIPEQVEDEPV